MRFPITTATHELLLVVYHLYLIFDAYLPPMLRVIRHSIRPSSRAVTISPRVMVHWRPYHNNFFKPTETTTTTPHNDDHDNEKFNETNAASPADELERQDIDEVQVRLKRSLEKLPMFIESKYPSHAWAKERSSDGVSKVQSIPLSTDISEYREILYYGRAIEPTPGSLVEFLPDSIASDSSAHSTTAFGVVLEGCTTKFNENFNKLTILTTENELLRVSPQDVTLHFPSIVSWSWIQKTASSEILSHRENSTTEIRMQLVHFLRSFIVASQSVQERLSRENQFELVYSHFKQPFSSAPVSLEDFLNSMKLNPIWRADEIDSNIFSKCTLLMACHMEMSNDPQKWIVPTMYKINRTSNVVSGAGGCSNNLTPPTVYLTNSMENHDAIGELLTTAETAQRSSSQESAALLPFMAKLLQTQTEPSTRKSFIDLTLYFTIWDGAKYKWIVDAMKLFVLYPHPAISQSINSLGISALLESDSKVAPSSVHRFLKRLGIYDSNGGTSDIHFSANVYGKPSLNQLAVRTATDLTATETQLLSTRVEDEVNGIEDDEQVQESSDHFPHLRDSNRFYKDLTIYGLPTDSGSSGSTIGISIEKSNVRKFWFNIHVQDPATRIPPTSKLFESVASSSSRTSTKNLFNGQSLELFDKRFLEQFAFKTQNIKETSFVSVGDLDYNNGGELLGAISPVSFPQNFKKTCMTISFAYYPYSNDPFKNLSEKVKVTFDDIKELQIKAIPSVEELEKVLSGKAESSESGGFKLFKRRLVTSQAREHQETESLLNNKDVHDLRFIYNMTKTYSKVRNSRNASLLDPSTENTTENIDRDDAMNSPLSGYFLRELQSLSDDLSANYCYHRGIPVYASRQGLFEQKTLETQEEEPIDMETMFKHKETVKIDELPPDEVLLSHNNIMLPEFYASSYFQTLLSKDSYGNVSPSAKISGSNFLDRKVIEVMVADESALSAKDVGEDSLDFIDPLIQEGLLLGSVNVHAAASSFASLMNQYQILSHVHSTSKQKYFGNVNYLQLVERFSYLQRLGYPGDGPLSWEVLEYDIFKLEKEAEFQNYFKAAHKRFWKLQELERTLVETDTSRILDIGRFSCVVTGISNTLFDAEPTRKLATGFCIELGIELELLVNLDRQITVGNLINCDQIVYLDSIGGRCVLREEETI